VPVLGVVRRDHQILDGLGIKSVVHLERVERGLDRGQVGARGGLARLLAATDNLRDDQRRENADDGHDQQHFDERERAAKFHVFWASGVDFDFHNFSNFI
jgi:hypothetical protein